MSSAPAWLSLPWPVGFVATVCQSQTAPLAPPPGAVPQPEQLQQRAVPQKRDDADFPPPPVARELGKPEDDLTLDVTAYELDDSAPPKLRAALPALTAPYVGKQRSYEDLVNAAASVTRYLQRELGYYLGYAYLPEQAPRTA